MQSRRVNIAVFVLIACAGVSCSGASASPTSPSSGLGPLALTADGLAGTWTLTSLQPAGSAERATPEGTTYNATFENGRMSIRADCNVCSGAASVSSTAVVVSPVLACTRAACRTMDFEMLYESLLPGDNAATLDGRSLTLSSSRGRLTFTRN